MPFVEQITAFQFIAVIVVLFVLLMIANSILSLIERVRPKEGIPQILAKLTALTSRFDELDKRCSSIEADCSNCRKDYREDLGNIYSEIKGVRSSVDGLAGQFEIVKPIAMGGKR